MEVLMKSGRYAGELRDVRPDCARQMFADGRAVDPRVEAATAKAPSQGDGLNEFHAGRDARSSRAKARAKRIIR